MRLNPSTFSEPIRGPVKKFGSSLATRFIQPRNRPMYTLSLPSKKILLKQKKRKEKNEKGKNHVSIPHSLVRKSPLKSTFTCTRTPAKNKIDQLKMKIV